jgi:hypothetical protein
LNGSSGDSQSAIVDADSGYQSPVIIESHFVGVSRAEGSVEVPGIAPSAPDTGKAMIETIQVGLIDARRILDDFDH